MLNPTKIFHNNEQNKDYGIRTNETLEFKTERKHIKVNRKTENEKG